MPVANKASTGNRTTITDHGDGLVGIHQFCAHIPLFAQD
jgi:hypothetical protein